MPINESQVLDVFAERVATKNLEFGWATTLGQKFEGWLQIELTLSLIQEFSNSQVHFHPVNSNLARELKISNTSSYRNSTRYVDIAISCDGNNFNTSQSTLSIELKYDIPSAAGDIAKDFTHAINPAVLDIRSNNINRLSDRCMSVYVLIPNQQGLKSNRFYTGQIERLITVINLIQPDKSWALIRNYNKRCPDFAIIAFVDFNCEGVRIAERRANQPIAYADNWQDLLYFRPEAPFPITIDP